MAGQLTAALLVGIIIAVLTIAVNCQENEISISCELKTAACMAIHSIFICIYHTYMYTVASRANVCGLPSDQGPCKANAQRYFYNVQSGECEVFVYGGCQGNRNNFKSAKQCHRFCSKSACMCSVVVAIPAML